MADLTIRFATIGLGFGFFISLSSVAVMAATPRDYVGIGGALPQHGEVPRLRLGPSSPIPPDCFHLRGDLLHGHRSVLELTLNPSQLFEKCLVIKVACERLLLLLRKSVNEFFNLCEVEIELNRHFYSLSL